MVLHGAASVAKKIEAKRQQIERNHDRAARAAANALKVAMKAEAPYRTRVRGSGGGRHLRASVRVRRIPGGYRVKPESRVAHLVIRGVRAHHIEVKRKHALSFDAGGGHVFAHSANPGGFSGNPFVERARQIAAGEARNIAGAVLFHDAPDPNEGA